MYFKKFDTSPTSPSNTASHQYQTNVTAPASESEKTYESYANINLLDEPYTFDIPIYLNMPSVVSLPSVASIVNTLSEIKVDGKPISSFDRDVIEYTVYVPRDYTSVKIEATKDDNASVVTGLGSVTLAYEKTEHQIIVTAENGSKKTYKLIIIKVEDTTTVKDILSNLSVKVTGNIMNNISPDTASNTLIQSILKNSPTASVTIYNDKGVAINGASAIVTGGRI